MSKLLVTGVALAVMASAAQATTSLSFSAAQANVAQTVDYRGFTGSFNNGNTALPGLSARSIFTLRSIVGNTWTFDYSIANTSVAPVTSSRISLFGFNVSPNIASASSTGEFNGNASGNVPMVGNRDLCFGIGNTNNCSGGGGQGVTIGEAASTGVFRLIFQNPQTNVVLSGLFVRYQSLNAPSLNISGASGFGDVAVAVPEPTTWAMLIAGFGAIGGAMRRRRAVVAA